MDRREFIAVAGASLLMPKTAAAQSQSMQSASAADLAGDMAIMREALKLHPGLYRYNSPRGMESMIAH